MASYRDAGVDLDTGDLHVENIRSSVTATWTTPVVGGFGGFAAGVPIPDGYANPVLMLSTDGVGTKLDIARRADDWSGVGFDLVAMCVDDLAAVGAAPVGFVDYIAVGALNPTRESQIVRSIAAACTVADCPLVGGETAEHPGVMAPDAVDLAGTAAGIVESGEELRPERVSAGDLLVGLRSPNLRSNGFSLVRQVLEDEETQRHASTLLQPSVIYAPAVLSAIATGGVNAAAHITGGGLPGNVPRALPPGLGAEIDSSTWEVPEVFDLIGRHGVEREEMFRVFNMGIGFVLVVGPGKLDAVCDAVIAHAPVVIGRIGTTMGVRIS